MQDEKIEGIFKKFEEIQFLDNPKSIPEKLLLFLHSINLSNNLICTGLQEDDPVAEYILPPNWSIPVDNIYSFRYQSQTDKSQTFYFKIIYELQTNLFFINAVSSSKSDMIISLEISNISTYTNFTMNNQQIIDLFKNYQSNVISLLLKKPEKPQENTKKNETILRPNPTDFFWNRPRNNEPSPFMPSFGDYGSSDLRPVPLGGIGSGSGSLLGPKNPIFLGQQNPNNNMNPLGGPIPGVRFDPFGPDGFNGSFSGFDGGIPKNPRFGGSNGFGGFI